MSAIGKLNYTDMKKLVVFIMAIILSLTVLPVRSFAYTTDNPVPAAPAKPLDKTESAEARALVMRLNEIKTMDMSKMTTKDKKAIQKEKRTIKRKLKDISGGVWISATTLIIILILLVILT